MLKDGVIVDTSVLIDYLKGSEPYAGAVCKLIQDNRVVTTGIIIAELVQGIRTLEEEHTISEILTSLIVLETDTDVWVKAGRLSLSLRKKGVSLPLTDVAIAALGIEYNLSIFTLDKHFNQIPGVKIYKA